MANQDPIIQDANLYLSFQMIKDGKFNEAQNLIQNEIDKAKEQNNRDVQGLYLSTLGVLFKKMGDYKKSYKCYQEAEKCLPNDDSLKLISAKLLIQNFNQFDTAIRKLDKILKSEIKDAAILHHCLNLKGIAYFKSGKKEKTKEILSLLVKSDFSRLRAACNINFNLVELLLKKDFERELCKTYLEKSLVIAQKNKEEGFIKSLNYLLKNFIHTKS